MAKLLMLLGPGTQIIFVLNFIPNEVTTMRDFSSKNHLNALYVGIDVDSIYNVVSIINFNQDLLTQFKIKTNQSGIETIKNKVIEILTKKQEFKFI